jgi:peptidyl-prolyl cis-trans isomerase D
MLQTIRERASGLIAYIIIGLLIIPFAFWGIQTYFSHSETQDVAAVGDSKISLREFQQAYQRQRQRLPQVDAAVLKNVVLQQLVNEQLLLQAVREQGLRISDQQLSEAIRSLAVFQQDGRFNAEHYQQVLRAQGYSEFAFEENLRRSLALEQLQAGLTASAITTPAELNQAIELLNQQRELQYLLLPLDNYLKKATVDENAITAYFQENKDRFQKPEQVQVDYLELKLDKMAEKIPVSEEELQTVYQEQSAKYTQPEERRASHILVPVSPGASPADIDKARERAKAIRADITSGAKTFEQALQDAKAAGDVQGGELGVISKGMYADPAFENALFALHAVGDSSEPVQTTFGFHLIRLEGITPERVRSFAEVRDTLAKEWRLHQAEARFYDLSEKLSNAIYEHPDSLEPAAQVVGLESSESPWFTRQGGEGIAAYPQVVEAAFSDEVLKRGANSEPLEVEPNHIIVIRLKNYKEATPLSLEEARRDIEKELRNRQAREAVGKDVEMVRQRIAQGESLEVLAGELGGELKKPGLVGRRDTQLDNALLKEVFRLPLPEAGKPSVGSVQLANGDQAVIVISRVVPGEAGKLQETERKTLAQQLARQTGTTEFEGFLDSLRKKIPIVMHQDKL